MRRGSDRAQWWKGNLHTHTLWSDGYDYPEVAAEWYKEHGWSFVVFTEHDRLMEGEERLDVLDVDGPQRWPRSARAQRMLPAYRERFGGGWVEERQEGDAHLVRLRELGELRRRYAQRITSSASPAVRRRSPALPRASAFPPCPPTCCLAP